MPRRTGGFIGHRGLQAPDPPTAVTPTAGNAQVSVAFTAPSDVGDDAITGFNVQSNNADGQMLIGISSATYDNVEFSVNSLDSVPTDVAFNSDGTKMYVLGIVSDKVHQFTLSTAFDLSTASSDSVNFSVGSQDINPYGIAFNNNGTKMYMAGNTSDSIHQYTLSTGFDLSTASYDSVSLNVNSQESIPAGVQFNSNGTKMYVVGQSSNNVHQYTLSTAFDLSTASYDSVSLDVSSLENVTSALAFNNDGTKLYIVGFGNSTIFQHTLSTAFDLSTASYDSLSLDVSSTEGNPRGLAFNNDDTKMYVIGPSTDKVHQFTTNFNSYPSASPIVISGLTNGTSYTVKAFAINDYGTSAPSEASASFTPVAPARGLFGGFAYGFVSNTNVIQYIDITSTGNTTDFGDLTVSRGGNDALASTTRAVFAGGFTGSAWSDVMDYVTIDSTGNATDFGNLQVQVAYLAGSSNSTRGIWAGGSNNSNDRQNAIQYITIASTGNVTDFGDLTVARRHGNGCSSPTRSITFAGGDDSKANNTKTNILDYVTIASTGNAIDFGNLTAIRDGVGAASSSTRGVFAGGAPSSNIIEYITIASAGNATDFGDLSSSVQTSGTSSSTRAVFAYQSSNTIEYITISTTGNASDFGDSLGNGGAACSQNHGGLA